MGRLVGANTRAWMLCTVALLWAWEATADDPDAGPAEVAAAPADPAVNYLPLWDPAPVTPTVDRVRGGR